MKLVARSLNPFARLLGSPPGEIGLYLANDHVCMVQCENSAHGPRIRAAASQPFPCARDALVADPRTLKALLRPMLAGSDFRGRRVVSSLRAAELQIFPLSYVLADGQDDAAAIVGELRERLKGSIDDFVIDYIPIRRADGEAARREALVAVAPRESVIRHLELLEGAGLQVGAIDVGPAALSRLVSFVNSAQSGEQHPNVLVINFGAAKSYLSVVWGCRLILDREIEFGERALQDRVARVLDMDGGMALRILRESGFRTATAADGGNAEMAQTLAEVLRPELSTLTAEVNTTLIYTASRSRGRSIDRIYLLGNVARYPGMDRMIHDMLAIPVEVLDPIDALGSLKSKAARESVQPPAGFAIACGLALRGFANHE